MKIVLGYGERVRVRLRTPKKGTLGDMTIESQVSMTDINAILKRYGGNTEALAAWRGKLSFGDATTIPSDYGEAFERMKAAHDAFDSLPDNPFASFDEAMKAIKEGTFEEAIVNASKKKNETKPTEVNDEKKNLEENK